MSVFDILKVAYSSLGTNRLRSLLTMLGVIIGVGAVITMLAVGTGAKSLVESQIASLGTNVIMVFPGATRQHGVSYGAGTSIRLKEEDAVAMLRECESLMYVSPMARSGGQVVAGNVNWATRVEGAYPDYVTIRDWSLESGEYLTESDERNAAKVCLMGQTVAEAVFGEDEDPVGKTIRFRRLPLKVKGLLQAKGPNFFGSDQDDILIVPFSTLQRRILGVTWASYIISSAVSREAVPDATREIGELLRSRHKLRAGEEDDFRIRDQTQLADTAGQTSRTLGMLLAAIASISLLVGGIGIMNIMLVTVTERTREIGIRMSVGARTKDILFQFLVEAVTLSCLGGLIGIALGMASSRAISAGAGWPVLVSPLSVFMAVAFAALVGVGFGFYPAWKASHLDPIEALRYE